jgi:hypothetical protein
MGIVEVLVIGGGVVRLQTIKTVVKEVVVG